MAFPQLYPHVNPASC